MSCNEESATWGVLAWRATSSTPNPGVCSSSGLFRFSPYIANCTEESDGWDFGKGEAILTSPSSTSHVFLPLPFSLIIPSWATLSAGLSQVFLVLLSGTFVSEVTFTAWSCSPLSCETASSAAAETESSDRLKSVCCSDLSSASVCTPLAISDIKLGFGAWGVTADLSPPGFSSKSSPRCADTTGVWVPLAWGCVSWTTCSLKLSNRACSCARNWTLAVSSSLRLMRHWARNSL